MASSHVKKLEVTEMKICSWACGHTLRDHGANYDIRDRLRVDNITEVQESETEVVCILDEKRQRIRRTTNIGDGTTRDKKTRKTEAKMDGLGQPRHES